MFRNSTYSGFYIVTFLFIWQGAEDTRTLESSWTFYTVVMLIMKQLVINQSICLVAFWMIHLCHCLGPWKIIFTLWILSHLASCKFSHWFNPADPLIGWKLNLDSRGNLVYEHIVNNLGSKFTQMKSAWNNQSAYWLTVDFWSCPLMCSCVIRLFMMHCVNLFRCRIRKLVIHCLCHITGHFLLPDLSSDSFKFALNHPPSVVRWAKSDPRWLFGGCEILKP